MIHKIVSKHLPAGHCCQNGTTGGFHSYSLQMSTFVLNKKSYCFWKHQSGSVTSVWLGSGKGEERATSLLCAPFIYSLSTFIWILKTLCDDFSTLINCWSVKSGYVAFTSGNKIIMIIIKTKIASIFNAVNVITRNAKRKIWKYYKTVCCGNTLPVERASTLNTFWKQPLMASFYSAPLSLSTLIYH